MFAEFTAAGPQADEQVTDWDPLAAAPWTSLALPVLVALYFDSDVATDVQVYYAPAQGADERDRIMLINATATLHEARSCLPIWVDPSTRVPYPLFVTTSAGTSRLRFEWTTSP